MKNAWVTVWNDCIFPTLKTIYDVMNSIKIYDFSSGYFISLWDLCIAVIVMGAIINLFINFTTPTMPDRWESGVSKRFVKNSKYKAGQASEKIGRFYR